MGMRIEILALLRRQPLSMLVFLGGLLIAFGYVGAYALPKAEVGGTAQLDLFTMGMGLLGGLALFLFGMEQMADSLKALAADRLKDVLARLTTNRFMGAITGALVTAIIQSSSVTTVLTVGFITAGILSLSQAVGIIFGANIGTTLTAQIIAFKVTKFALLMIAVGFGMLFISAKEKTKQYGAMIMGLGLVFFGMGVMSGAMKPLRSYGPFLDLMGHMENPLLGILVAALFTSLVQSSSATTGVVIAMAAQGLISLNAGIALAFGANIGTCVTALLASIGKPREAVRAGLVHALFNVAGVIIWIGFIDYLAQLVTWVSPVAAGLSGTEKLAAESPRQIANAHTVFNVVNTILLLPFAGQFARLAERLLPDKEEAPTEVTVTEWTTIHLDPDLITVPSIALEQTRGEIRRIAGMARGMVEEIMPAFVDNNFQVAEDVLQREEEVDYIAAEIDNYLIQISRRPLNQAQSEFGTQLMNITHDVEHISDLVKRDLVPLLHKKVAAGFDFPAEWEKELLDYHRHVLENFDAAMEAFRENSPEEARSVIRSKTALTDMEESYRMTHFSQLTQSLPGSRETSHIYLDLADYLQRINSYSESIAFTMLEGFLDTRHRPRKTGPGPEATVAAAG